MLKVGYVLGISRLTLSNYMSSANSLICNYMPTNSQSISRLLGSVLNVLACNLSYYL